MEYFPTFITTIYTSFSGKYYTLAGQAFYSDGMLSVSDSNGKPGYLDENGNLVKPEEPNGCKFEQLVLDMIHELKSCLPYEVVREHEFAPIKNKTGKDSVESARELCKKNNIEL